jgi:hypothetical protein
MILFIMSLIPTLFCIGTAIFLMIGDIAAGALHGEPETGWGFLIAFMFFLPLAAVCLFVNHLLFKWTKRLVAADDSEQPPMPPQAPDQNITVG